MKHVCRKWKMQREELDERFCGLQLQQGKVGVAIVGPLFALLGDIVLKHGRGLGVVPVEAVEDGIDVVGPVGRGVESYAHI